jgi:hypothetical protein
MNGDPLPQFERQSKDLKHAWELAATAVIMHWLDNDGTVTCDAVEVKVPPPIDPPTNTC